MTEKSLILSITLLNKSNITSTKTSVNTHRFEYFENLGALFKKKNHSLSIVHILIVQSVFCLSLLIKRIFNGGCV